jgi:hypothetical protein
VPELPASITSSGRGRDLVAGRVGGGSGGGVEGGDDAGRDNNTAAVATTASSISSKVVQKCPGRRREVGGAGDSMVLLASRIFFFRCWRLGALATAAAGRGNGGRCSGHRRPPVLSRAARPGDGRPLWSRQAIGEDPSLEVASCFLSTARASFSIRERPSKRGWARARANKEQTNDRESWMIQVVSLWSSMCVLAVTSRRPGARLLGRRAAASGATPSRPTRARRRRGSARDSGQAPALGSSSLRAPAPPPSTSPACPFAHNCSRPAVLTTARSKQNACPHHHNEDREDQVRFWFSALVPQRARSATPPPRAPRPIHAPPRTTAPPAVAHPHRAARCRRGARRRRARAREDETRARRDPIWLLLRARAHASPANACSTAPLATMDHARMLHSLRKGWPRARQGILGPLADWRAKKKREVVP